MVSPANPDEGPDETVNRPMFPPEILAQCVPLKHWPQPGEEPDAKPYDPVEWAELRKQLTVYSDGTAPALAVGLNIAARMMATIDLQQKLMLEAAPKFDYCDQLELAMANILQGNGGQLRISGENVANARKAKWCIEVEPDYDAHGGLRFVIHRPKGKLVLARG